MHFLRCGTQCAQGYTGVLTAYSRGMWHTYMLLWVVYAQAREGQRDWKYPRYFCDSAVCISGMMGFNFTHAE